VLLTSSMVRPYMATRMPQFGEANVKSLATALVAAIKQKSGHDVVVDPGSPQIWPANVGTPARVAFRAMCLRSCVAGPFRDGLTAMTERLNSDWFRRYLLNPPSLRPGTRMPSYWPDDAAAIKTVLDGDTEKQITAIWSYLSDRARAALPPGLIPARNRAGGGPDRASIVISSRARDRARLLWVTRRNWTWRLMRTR